MAIHPNIVDLRYVFVPPRAALVPNQRPRANVFPKSELGTDGDSIESKKKPQLLAGLEEKGTRNSTTIDPVFESGLVARCC
jgi:hypothetical protein